MAINYASKYAQKIDEKFARESMTSAAVNNDYDFVGVKTVNVYSVPTADERLFGIRYKQIRYTSGNRKHCTGNDYDA